MFYKMHLSKVGFFLILFLLFNRNDGQKEKCKKTMDNLIKIVGLEDIPPILLNDFQLKGKVKQVQNFFYNDSLLQDRRNMPFEFKNGHNYYTSHDHYLKKFSKKRLLIDDYGISMDSLKMIHHDNYDYYANGRLKTIIEVSGHWRRPDIQKYTYDKGIVRYEYGNTWKKDTTIYEIHRYKWDIDGNVDKTLTLQNQRYDSENGLTKSKILHENCSKFTQLQNSDSLIYTLHPNGRKKSAHYYKSGVLSTVSEYNTYEQETSSINHSYSRSEFNEYNEGKVIHTRSGSDTIAYSYLVFDEENNWTLRAITRTEDGESFKIYEHRKIEYY